MPNDKERLTMATVADLQRRIAELETENRSLRDAVAHPDPDPVCNQLRAAVEKAHRELDKSELILPQSKSPLSLSRRIEALVMRTNESPPRANPSGDPMPPTRHWTPLHLELMIHYAVCAQPFPRAHAPAVVRYTNDLRDHGLIEPCEGGANFCATGKGQAFLRVLLRTPMPERRAVCRTVWVDDRGREIPVV